MKRFTVFFLLAGFVFTTTPLFAARGGEKGASDSAYEHASPNAIFNKVSDWFTTIGKSKEEKSAILEERRAEREKKRAEKVLKKEKKKQEKVMK